MAPNSIAVHSIGRNGRTTAYRSTGVTRHSASGSVLDAGPTLVMFATAVRSSARDTTVSIASQTSSSVISGPHAVASSSTPTAAASFPASLRTRGYRRACSSRDWRRARASSSVVISTSNSSTASSLAFACRYATVASSVASLRVDH